MSVHDIQKFTNAISLQQLVKYVIKKGDFCGAIIPADYLKSDDFNQAELLLERRADRFFMLANRKNFVGSGLPIITWSGLFNDFIAGMTNSKFGVAYQAAIFFMTRSPLKKEFLLLPQGLDAIHYKAAYAILGERAYFIKDVQKGQKKKRPPVDTTGTHQLKLF